MQQRKDALQHGAIELLSSLLENSPNKFNPFSQRMAFQALLAICGTGSIPESPERFFECGGCNLVVGPRTICLAAVVLTI